MDTAHQADNKRRKITKFLHVYPIIYRKPLVFGEKTTNNPVSET
jgi:hypothetical protein